MEVYKALLCAIVAAMICGCQERNGTESKGAKEVFVDLDKVEYKSTESGRLIPLESTDSSLIYDVCSLVETGKSWIVQSRSLIKEYDKDSGKFIKDFGKEGDGPGEYHGIQHFWSCNDTIRLLDFNTGCIMDYNLSGDFLGKSLNFYELRVEANCMPVYVVESPNRKEYYVINSYTGGSTPSNPQYSIINKNGEFIQFVPGRELYDGSFTPDRMYTDYEHNRVLAWEQLRDTLFTVDASGVTPIYTFNFGKNRFPIESQTHPEFYKRVEDFSSNKSDIPYASLIKYYQCKGNNLFFSFTTCDKEQHNECYLGVYDEKTKRMRTYKFASANGRYQQAPFFKVVGKNLVIAMTDKMSIESNPLLLEIPIEKILW